ncbi:uncharacterized protein LOC135496133 [Lineus longissimus]|uniref:uncharacterized protein LOC135496133 n=1 Tax=Lineus longissimus TaxID=88925 RepID=UPI00315DA0E6
MKSGIHAQWKLIKNALEIPWKTLQEIAGLCLELESLWSPIVQSLLQDSPSKASEVSNTPTLRKKRRKNYTEPPTPPDADVIPTPPPVKHDVDTQTDWDMAFMQRIDGMLYGSVEVIQHDHSYSKANQPDQDSTFRPRSSSEGTREADLQPPQPSPDISSAGVLQSCQLLPGAGSNLHVDDALAATSESDVTSDDSDFELPTTARKVDDSAKHFDILNEDQFSNSAGDYIEQEKFIVYEGKLLEIFLSYGTCPDCGQKFGTICTNRIQRGSLVTFRLVCKNHHVFYWHSQPVCNKAPVGNISLAASILFTGNTFTSVMKFAKLMNIRFITKSTFHGKHNLYLFPVVDEAWREHRSKLVQALQDRLITVIGDGRCDSPGHSVKYGTYTVMGAANEKVIDFSLKQVRPDLKSCNMEKERLIDCLDSLKHSKITVGVLATDRHPQISKMMRTNYKEINHQYDVWHFAKSI